MNITDTVPNLLGAIPTELGKLANLNLLYFGKNIDSFIDSNTS